MKLVVFVIILNLVFMAAFTGKQADMPDRQLANESFELK